MGLGPSSSRPVAVSPPFWGWVCFGGLAGVVVHLRDAWRGFSSLGWLAGCSPGSLSFYFEQLVSMQGASASTPLFPGRRVVVSEAGLAVRVLLLATSLPLPMVFP